MTDNASLAAQLEKTLPLLDGLEVGQECEEYAFARGEHFQAMVYCPDAFEALRCIPAIITALRADQRCAELGAELEQLNRNYEAAHLTIGTMADHKDVLLATIAELEAENARLRSELNAASDVILLAVKNAPGWTQLAHAFHERRKALENRHD